MSQQQEEPLLIPQANRYTLFPLSYPDIYQHYKKATSAYWLPEEVNPETDIIHWKTKLNDNERFFIKNILAFFAGSDDIVMENLATRFYNEVKIAEARQFYAFQIAIEGIHSEMYSILIDTYITDKQEQNHLFNAINTMPCISKKAEWSINWIDNSGSFGQRLIAFAIVEGVFFSGAFCAIYWLKKRGLMPALCLSNEFISGDEATHTEFAVLLYSKIVNRVPFQTVKNMFLEAVELEKDFIISSIPCSMIGMNVKLMSQYIEFVADRLLVQLGYNKIFNSTNPFEFMESISIRGKNNFFDRRSSEYAKPSVGQSTEERKFSLNADF